MIDRPAASGIALASQMPTSAHVDLASVAIYSGQGASSCDRRRESGVGDALSKLGSDVRQDRNWASYETIFFRWSRSSRRRARWYGGNSGCIG
jgi:hypothetical protein